MLTASDLVRAIHNLPKERAYYYINPATKTAIQILDVVLPEGPIVIKRYNPENQGPKNAQEVSISSQMLWRIANAFQPEQPINFDRVLGASYNTRSALEALLAHTPHFFVGYPGRIESTSSTTAVKKGHKHLIWSPNGAHEPGVITEKETDVVISEIPGQEIVYDALTVPDEARDTQIDIEVQRRHAQIQIALIMAGKHLGYKVWVAQNDKGIIYKQKRLGEMEGVLPNLKEGILISPWQEAIRAALLIDCLWFKNARLMPAVMEIEHSTGITSGLTRMKKLQDHMPPILTRYVIVAPDEEREKAVREINQEQFRSLDARFFPYSAVEELWALCERRKIQGVTEEFLDSFMEPVLKS